MSDEVFEYRLDKLEENQKELEDSQKSLSDRGRDSESDIRSLSEQQDRNEKRIKELETLGKEIASKMYMMYWPAVALVLAIGIAAVLALLNIPLPV